VFNNILILYVLVRDEAIICSLAYLRLTDFGELKASNNLPIVHSLT